MLLEDIHVMCHGTYRADQTISLLVYQGGISSSHLPTWSQGVNSLMDYSNNLGVVFRRVVRIREGTAVDLGF